MQVSGMLRPVLTAAAVITLGLSIRPASVEAQVGVTTYRACYVPGSGTVYRIGVTGTPDTCKNSSHIEFQWTDFIGAIDPTIVFNTVSIDPGDAVIGEAKCPANSVLYTGGFALHSDQLRILASAPDPNPNELGTWTVQVKNEGSASTSFAVYARCVKS